MKYPAENWKMLGKWVATARRSRGFSETLEWAEAVERSPRMLLGLERGEGVGDGTLKRIASALGVEVSMLYLILGGEADPVGGPEQDAFVASPGELTEAGVSNDELLREIRAVRRDQLELSQRVANLEQQRAQPLGGAGSPV